ncbi:sugar phosphate isomerase/epimerase family protein [Mucilaginibacter sp. McL0603]|uniref:sugar phosphate isomerase/epimerase family protein n=1 Tax=Mucilaginibacter sp. McL0603 TaxID=3415670 RepID=UPI003CE8BABA
MLNRRKFLAGTGAAALSALLLPKAASAFFADAGEHALGVQLYTLFNIIEADVKGNLKKIADIGYKEIESAFSKLPGYYGMKPKEFASLCSDLGMSWKSHHVLGAPFKMPKGMKMPAGMTLPPHMANLKEDMQALVDQAAEGGISYLVCANIPTETLDEIKNAGEILNKTGEACKKVNIQLCYHNHDMEFKDVEGKIPYNLLLSETQDDLVKMELDLAWATKAGVDPVALFKAHPGRFPLLHVKDISKDFTTLEPVGEGVVDFKRIFANAETAGVKHYFVEHDMPKDAFASIATSYKNLRAMGV